MTLIKSCHLFAKSVSECVRGRLTITRHIKREMKRGTVAVVLHDFVCTRSEHHSRHTGLTVHTQSTVNVWNISTLTSLGSASGFCVQNVASYFQCERTKTRNNRNTPCLSRHFKLLWDLKTIYLTCFFFTNSNWLSVNSPEYEYSNQNDNNICWKRSIWFRLTLWTSRWHSWNFPLNLYAELRIYIY